MTFRHQHTPTRKFLVGSTPTFVLRSCPWNSGNAPLGFLLVKISPAGIETKEILIARKRLPQSRILGLLVPLFNFEIQDTQRC